MKKLFKAKRADTGEWIEGYYLFNSKEHFIVSAIGSGIPVIPESICQAIGRTDKNGKEVFIGDKFPGDPHMAGELFDWVIYWDSEDLSVICRAFAIGEEKSSDSERINEFDLPEIEITGNINDNN